MRMHVAALAAALPLVVAGAAQAADTPSFANQWSASNHPWYGEIGYTRTQIDSDVRGDLSTVNLRGGGQWGHWGGEMEVGTGLGSTATSVNGTPFNLKMNWQVGVYAVGYLPVAKGLDLFARVGAVGAEFHEDVYGGKTSNNEHGWAAGVGARYFFNGGPNGVRVDYTRYGLQDDFNNIGVSYVRKF